MLRRAGVLLPRSLARLQYVRRELLGESRERLLMHRYGARERRRREIKKGGTRAE